MQRRGSTRVRKLGLDDTSNVHSLFLFFDDHVIDQFGEYRAYEDGLSLKAALYFSKDSSQKKDFHLSLKN